MMERKNTETIAAAAAKTATKTPMQARHVAKLPVMIPSPSQTAGGYIDGEPGGCIQDEQDKQHGQDGCRQAFVFHSGRDACDHGARQDRCRDGDKREGKYA